MEFRRQDAPPPSPPNHGIQVFELFERWLNIIGALYVDLCNHVTEYEEEELQSGYNQTSYFLMQSSIINMPLLSLMEGELTGPGVWAKGVGQVRYESASMVQEGLFQAFSATSRLRRGSPGLICLYSVDLRGLEDFLEVEGQRGGIVKGWAAGCRQTTVRKGCE